MSRRRKPNSRRPNNRWTTGTDGFQRSRSSNAGPGTGDIAAGERMKLILRSCVFVAPEEAVTTVEVVHPATLVRRAGGRVSPGATIIKGCPSRHALENCESLQMGTLSYYRKQGDSLIWDLLEGVIAGDERVQNRRDNPADIEAYQQRETERSDSHPLKQALDPTTISRLDVNETSRSSLLLGDNCLIWCTSIQPQTAKEWSLWRKSLESHYDHTTSIGEPAPFARALAMMASSQRDLLGSRAELRHPETGHMEECGNLTVYYGPVAYLNDPRDYILESDDDLERIVRRIFTKTTEHRHQREFRFVILTQESLDRDIVHLRVPSSIREVLKDGVRRKQRLLRIPEVGSAHCTPSPRLLRCFAADVTQGSAVEMHGLRLTVNMRQKVHISGTHDKSSTIRTLAVSDVVTADHERLEAEIRSQTRSSDDARIAKLTIDGGPGTVTHFYCMEGIWGRISYRAVSGKASLKFRGPERDGTIRILHDNKGFDGLFKLSHSARQLILTVVPVNPAAAVRIAQPCRNPDLPHNHITLSPNEDTHVTVTAISEDGTQISSFEISIDRALSRLSESGAA